MCLLLGATGVGKTLLVKRLQKLSSRDGKGDLGDPPPTRPTVGTNLTDIVAQSKITIRELGGCMGPIWPSYYGNCRSLLTCAQDSRRSNLPWRSNGPTSRETSVEFMMDASNPTQLSASCVLLLGLLSAEELAEASVLILFNKIDLPCYMTTEEMKSLIRLPDLVACAKQNITTAEISARNGTGLLEVLRWLQDTHRANG
nr:ADP-ribosylation factor-like protein 16 isoform X1 [Vicugna pacos]